MTFAMKNHITPFEKSPSLFVKKEYSEGEKKKIVSYMLSIEPDTALGLIWDCVAGKEVRKENVGYQDEEFMWTSQDVYHIEKYNAAVTDQFENHVLSRMNN